MSIQELKPHFVLLPYMAQGHMLPMVDLARLLANHGLIISILTTPVNAARFQSIIDRAVSTGLDIHVTISNSHVLKWGFLMVVRISTCSPRAMM
ncbi:UNVERIFIED_CONTAM: UDP-glycosyltransferase 73C5 [Sesamum radiatum]|uniref:UDP-glycosyltransferase 73C5 n=1 Tax=Sesamum radiatum TaxID=300843 RepID=A0AAW2L9V5_SESRA